MFLAICDAKHDANTIFIVINKKKSNIMDDLLDLVRKVKLDFSKTIVEEKTARGGIGYFPLVPKDFIKYAKEDFKLNNEKGLINSLSNAKRAIDCQIDTLLYRFGITYDKFNSTSEDIIKLSEDIPLDLPYKLQLVQALKFSPSYLISKVREERNKMEHSYQIPDKKLVREAIDIAELFILSCESRTNYVDDDFLFSSSNFLYKEEDSEYLGCYNRKYKNKIEIDYSYSDRKLNLNFFIDNKEFQNISLTKQSSSYYFLIRMIITSGNPDDFLESFKLFLRFLEHPIPQKDIKIIY